MYISGCWTAVVVKDAVWDAGREAYRIARASRSAFVLIFIKRRTSRRDFRCSPPCSGLDRHMIEWPGRQHTMECCRVYRSSDPRDYLLFARICLPIIDARGHCKATFSTLSDMAPYKLSGSTSDRMHARSCSAPRSGSRNRAQTVLRSTD